VCAALALAVMPALADDKAACLAAAASGQKLRDAHALVEARDQFRRCAAAGCPAVVQSDCAGWVEAVEKVLPTVVLSAKNAAGADLFEVKVSLDGKPLAARLDGQAIPIDPGAHAFHFEAAGGTADQQILVKEGALSQPVTAVIAAAQAASPTPPQPAGGGSGQRTVAFVVGAVGIAGILAGSVLGVMASSSWTSAQNECGSPDRCPQPGQGVSDEHTASGLATGSTIAFVAGGAALAAGAALFLTAPAGRSSSATSAWTVAPALAPGVAGLSMRGGF
jgi:hypothetical protein